VNLQNLFPLKPLNNSMLTFVAFALINAMLLASYTAAITLTVEALT